MKKKVDFKKFKIILVIVIIILLVIGLVYMNKSQANSLTPNTTPNTTPTPIPTETPVPTETPTPTEIPDYQFNVYVATYEEENGITDEDLRNNQDTRYAMYEEIYLSGYDPDDARSDQEAGCTNEFLAGFLDYVQIRNTTGFNSETETTDENVDKDSPEYIKKAYNQEGQTISDWMKSQGVYTDEDGVIRWPDGDPVTFNDPDDLPEGFTFEAGPNQQTLENSQKAQEGAEKFASGQDEELNAVIDQLVKEGYYN